MATAPDLDPDRLRAYQFLVFSKVEGAMTSAMVHLGDRLGLYRTMAEAGEPLTSTELASRTGLVERWVREWAYNQASAKIIQASGGVDGEEERFALTPEGVAVLATPDHEAFGMGLFHYDAHGPEAAVGVELGFEP